MELRFVQDVQNLCGQQIASLGGPPDWIIIDTPPAMSVFTRSGLSVAEYVLASLRPRPSSVAGTRNMLKTLRAADALMGTPGRFLGGVITHWDGLDVSQAAIENRIVPVIREFGAEALQTYIPVDNRLETLEPGAETRGARAYATLAEEVMQYVE